MYKKAAQLKLRFPYRGQCGVEDLFDLSLTDLDGVYKTLKRQEGQIEDGLLGERTQEDEVLALKLSIVKDVFETKQAEKLARKARAEKLARKQHIMEIIADKQDAALMDMPLEELQGMIDEL